MIKNISVKPTNNQFFVASTVKVWTTGSIFVGKSLWKLRQAITQSSHWGTLNCVNSQRNKKSPSNNSPLSFAEFQKLLASLITIMKLLQHNLTSPETSLNQLNFYQEQNNYDIIVLQETNVKETQARDIQKLEKGIPFNF